MRLPLPCGSPVRSAAPRAKAPTGRDDAAATEIAEATNCLRETFPFSPMTLLLAEATTVLQFDDSTAKGRGFEAALPPFGWHRSQFYPHGWLSSALHVVPGPFDSLRIPRRVSLDLSFRR